MNESLSPGSSPEPKFYQFRVPAPSRGAVLATVAGVAVLGVALFAGEAGYTRHAAQVRLTIAQGELAPAANDLLTHDRAELTQVESDLQGVNRSLDNDLHAKTAKSIDVNQYAATQNGLSDRLQKIGNDLDSLDAKQAALLGHYQLPAGTALLSSDQRKALDDLRLRRTTDTALVTALDGRIAAVAQYRETLAASEKAAQARHERELANTRSMQEQATGYTQNQVVGETVSAPVAESAPAYYDPYAAYPYGYPYASGYYGGPYYYGPSLYIGHFWGGRGFHHR